MIHDAGDRTPRTAARVLLVEDHPLLAESLRICLDGAGHTTTVAPVDSRDTVLSAAGAARADVVLLDADLGPGIADPTSLVEPLTALGATVVVVSGTSDPVLVAAFVERGAAGFVHKGRSLDELQAAVVGALAGRPLLTEAERTALQTQLDVARRQRGPFERLTPREAHVLGDLMNGSSVADIAQAACVSEGTVRTQIRSILAKLGVNSQLAAVGAARRASWMPPAVHVPSVREPSGLGGAAR